MAPPTTEHRPLARNYRFPWRKGNAFRLLPDAPLYYPAMLTAIDQAEHYILLEMYLFESGRVATRFIDALCAAARRGVAVYVLIDGYGSKELSTADRQRLQDAAVDLKEYNPVRYSARGGNLFRNHRKLLLVDGRQAFTGGSGIMDEYDYEQRPDTYWHDLMVEIRGPCVGDWRDLFLETMARWRPGVLQLPHTSTPPAAGEQSGRVVQSHSAVHSELMRSHIGRIRGARRRVWLATAYFVPSRKLRRALRRGARRGVDVRLLVPGPSIDHPWILHIARRYYGRLLRNGVRIFEYQARFTHVKALLCDDWVSIGSSNVDRWNFRWNLEANQDVADATFARQAHEMLARDLEQAQEVDPARWRQRSRVQRLREWFWGYLVVTMLTWFSTRLLDPRGERDRGADGQAGPL